MGHADVETPAALVRPISLDLVTVGESGSGKTSADNAAVTAIRAREEILHAEAEAAWRSYRIARRAHAIAVKRIEANKALSPAAVATELAKLEEPVPPLSPALIPEDLTTQGLARAWSTMQPCLAWFTSEGGGIVKGATMSDELLHGPSPSWPACGTAPI